MVTMMVVFSESNLLSRIEGQEWAPDVVEKAIAFAAYRAPSAGYDKTEVAVFIDGAKTLTVRIDVSADMASKPDIVFDHICYLEREMKAQIGRDRNVGICTDIARAARKVIDAML